jgi:hypothetical protein
MKNTQKLILTSLVFFLPSNAFAANSISYDFITSMMQVSENFTLTLYDALTKSFQGLFYSIATIMVLIHMSRWLFGKPDVVGLLKLFISIVAVNSLAFTSGAFEEWIYRPIMQTVYALPAFVIKISAGVPVNTSDSDSLRTMFTSMDSTIESMKSVGVLVMQQKSFWSSSWLWIQGLFMTILFTGLYCVFVVMFTIGVVASHVMLAMAPFAIALIAFESFRGISFNIIRAFFSYALIPFFASIAMGMTLSAIKGLVSEANKLVFDGNVDLISDTFLLQAILIGVFSWFFHLKASQFASQTIGGAISDFGQSFASGVGIVGGVAGGAAGMTAKKIGGYAGAKAASGMRRGINKVRDRFA